MAVFAKAVKGVQLGWMRRLMLKDGKLERLKRLQLERNRRLILKNENLERLKRYHGMLSQQRHARMVVFVKVVKAVQLRRKRRLMMKDEKLGRLDRLQLGRNR